MRLVRWQPRTSLFWPETFRGLFDEWPGWNENDDFRVDLAEKDDRYVLSAELPGVKKEDIKVAVENNVLTITAEKRDESETKEKGVYRCERVYGKLSRSFNLGEAVNVEKIEGEYKDGVLTLNLLKKEEVKPRQIEVKLS
jgi:HSP20 family protein